LTADIGIVRRFPPLSSSGDLSVNNRRNKIKSSNDVSKIVTPILEHDGNNTADTTSTSDDGEELNNTTTGNDSIISTDKNNNIHRNNTDNTNSVTTPPTSAHSQYYSYITTKRLSSASGSMANRSMTSENESGDDIYTHNGTPAYHQRRDILTSHDK
jgi:hypothetical protein